MLLRLETPDTLATVDTADTLADAGEMAGIRAIAMPIVATPIPALTLFSMTVPTFPNHLVTRVSR